jgi:hypothetical protein
VVIARGKLSPVVRTQDATVEQIGAWMAGLFEKNDEKDTKDAHAAA